MATSIGLPPPKPTTEAEPAPAERPAAADALRSRIDDVLWSEPDGMYVARRLRDGPARREGRHTDGGMTMRSSALLFGAAMVPGVYELVFDVAAYFRASGVALEDPPFLDRIYYRGPESGHFDGERFFNPDGEIVFQATQSGRAGFFWRWITGADDRPVSVAALVQSSASSAASCGCGPASCLNCGPAAR